MGETLAGYSQITSGITKNSIKINDNHSLVVLLGIFIIYPFGAFILALTQASKRSSYVIYALFGMLFVWHMDDTGSSGYDDFLGIIERVKTTNVNFNEVYNSLISLITFKPDAPKEWYETFMIWLSKCFTNNPHFYFLLCSLPWLYFELSSLHTITSDYKFRQSLYCLIILMLFVLPRDIITLQNPRFTTATWMVIYATIAYYTHWKIRYKYVLLILLSPLIHSAFWFYVLAFVACNILLKFPSLSIKLLYISIPFSFLSYDFLVSINFSNLPLPPSLIAWINIYLGEASYSKYIAQDGASGFYWVGNLFSFLMKTAYLMIPIFLWKNWNQIKKNSTLHRFCSFYLAFYSIVSFIQFVPVLGERFYWLVRIFSIYIWFKALYPRYRWIIYFIFLSCSFAIFRRYFYGGAVSVCVPLDIFFEPLPIAILDSCN